MNKHLSKRGLVCIFLILNISNAYSASVDAIWTDTGSCNWSCNTNWDTNYPNGDQDTAKFITDTLCGCCISNLTTGTAISVTLSEDITLDVLTFDHDATITIEPGCCNSSILMNRPGASFAPTIFVNPSGSTATHIINADVNYVDDISEITVCSGGLTINGALSGSSCSNDPLSKKGAGTLTLGGSYSGVSEFVIEVGTLAWGKDNVMDDANSDMTLKGGTLDNNGNYTEAAMGTLTLEANSSIDLGTGGSLTFADSSGTTWTGATTLTIDDWTGSGSGGTGGKIFIGASAGTLTATQLSQITFTGFAAGAFLLNTGELVPASTVPEPSNALIVIATLFVGIIYRKHYRSHTT